LGLGQTMFRLRITKHLMFSSVYPQGSSKLASLSLRLSLPTQVREEGEDKGREHQHFPWPISCRVSSRRFDTTQHPYALVQKQWEKIKRKGRCECHASGDGEGQGQNYGYVCHGNLPSSAMWRLPEQGKDFRDCHHVLELSCARPLASPWRASCVKLTCLWAKLSRGTLAVGQTCNTQGLEELRSPHKLPHLLRRALV
jgi:hypothetical protein